MPLSSLIDSMLCRNLGRQADAKLVAVDLPKRCSSRQSYIPAKISAFQRFAKRTVLGEPLCEGTRHNAHATAFKDTNQAETSGSFMAREKTAAFPFVGKHAKF